MKILSWNTQGNNITNLKGLIKHHEYPEIVLVEEMGIVVNERSIFSVGTSSRGIDYDCYALAHNRAKNERCTTAIMVRNNLDHDFIPPDRFDYSYDSSASNRPPMGAFVSGVTFIGIHAIANRSAAKKQVPLLLTQIARLTNGGLWILGGDFNLPPDDLSEVIDPNEEIYISSPDSMTQKSGGTLDYFVHNLEENVTVTLAQDSFTQSDHLAVLAQIDLDL